MTSKLKSPSAAFATANPFRSLVAYLKDPLNWAKSAACVAFALLHATGRQVSDSRREELVALLSTSSAPDEATAVKSLLAGQSEPGGDAVAAWLSFGEEHEGALLLVAQKTELGALANRPESVQAVLRLRDRQQQRQSEGFRSAWLAWMRAQNFLQFLPGLELTSDERIDPPVIEQVGEEASAVVRYLKPTVHHEPAVKAAETRAARPRPDFDRILEDLDESIHPLLRAAKERGFADFAAPFEVVGPNGVEGEIEIGWPELQLGLYFDQQSSIAKRLEGEGWRLLPIEARPSPAQLLALLEGT